MTVPLFYDRENPKKQVALTAIALRATAQREIDIGGPQTRQIGRGKSAFERAR